MFNSVVCSQLPHIQQNQYEHADINVGPGINVVTRDVTSAPSHGASHAHGSGL